MLHYKTVKYTILMTPEYEEWLAEADKMDRAYIDMRLGRIERDGHFGKKRPIEGGIFELKWEHGLRVYGVLVKPNYVLLYGGNKNGQSRDIRKAKRILETLDQRRLKKRG